MCNLFVADVFLHPRVVIGLMTINAFLRNKTPASLDYLVVRDPRTPFKRVNVLREALVKEPSGSKKTDKRMCEGGPVFSGVYSLCKSVDYFELFLFRVSEEE